MSFKIKEEIDVKMMEVMTKVPVAGLTLRWRGWRMRWTSSGASWSTGSPPPSARPAQGTSKTSRLLKTMINFKSLLSSIWEASNSKTVHSSSESRTIVDGKEVEGSKTSYSARFLSVCSLKLFFQSCFWSKGRGRHSSVCLGSLQYIYLETENVNLSECVTFCQWIWFTQVIQRGNTFLHLKGRAVKV